MTAYFDSKHEQLRRFDITRDDVWRPIEEFELRLVWDVTLAAEWPGMPEDLRDAIHQCVLKYGIASQPLIEVDGDLRQRSGPSPDTLQEHVDLLHRFIWDLHSIFHEVAKRNPDGFSDSPEAPLRCLFSQGETRREAMAKVTG